MTADGTARAVAARIVPNVKRIAVLRANAVGDFVLALPALEALRKAYPDAALTLLGTRWHADFLAGRDGPVDETVCLPSIAGVTAPAGAGSDAAELCRFFSGMRERRFDLALQLHGGGLYSNPLALALGARVTAGFRAPEAAALDRNFPYLAAETDLHPRVLLLLECAGLVGAVAPGIEPRISLRDADREELDNALPGLRGPLAVLQPGAADPRRRWHPDHFAAVGDALAAHGARVIVNGGPGEFEVAQRVCDAMKSAALNIAGRLSVGGLCALLAQARILVSNDTGPAHLARALGIPTATVYWIGNLRSYGPLSARRHGVAVSYRIHCPVCGKSCIGHQCGHKASFVDDVPAGEVIEIARRLYAADEASEA